MENEKLLIVVYLKSEVVKGCKVEKRPLTSSSNLWPFCLRPLLEHVWVD